MPPLAHAECSGPTDSLLRHGQAVQDALQHKIGEQIEAMMAQITPGLLEGPDSPQLVVGSEDMAQMVREYLAERGHESIEVVVAASLPAKSSQQGNYWTPAMAEAKAAYARDHDALGQRVRHRAKFTKSQPGTQARKAARRRAKAGRRASR